MNQENFQSLFEKIKDMPVDPIFGIVELYKNDKRPEKIHLSAGILIDEAGRAAPQMEATRQAEMKILGKGETKNYLPIDGDPLYVEETGKLLFGEFYNPELIYGAQTVGGTGALRVAAECIQANFSHHICVSNPTWANHIQIFHKTGFQIDYYPYADPQFEFSRIYDHLSALKADSVVLLQPMGHNPTGFDFSSHEWKELSDLFHKKRLIPFFDSAYQGLCRGLEEDASPIRLFMQEGHEFFVAHSYSKSMGLYNERVGAFYVVLQKPEWKGKVQRNIRALIRANYSNPPYHGAHIAKICLTDPSIRSLWESEVGEIRERITGLRSELADQLEESVHYKSFEHIRKGSGFFTLIGLSKEKVLQLQEEYGIYMTYDSRINLAALSQVNMGYIVESIAKVGL